MSNRKYYQLISGQKDIVFPSVVLPKKSSDMFLFSLYFTSKNGNIDALEKTFNVILRDNDALRIRLKTNAKGIKQYFDDYRYVKVPIIEIENEDKLADEIKKYRQMYKIYTGGALCNAFIFVYDDKATILINVHHIVIDGQGLSLLVDYFIRIYSEIINGTYIDEINDSNYTFEQFVLEKELYLKSKKHTKDIKYYKDKFNSNKKLKIIGPILKPKSKVDNETFSLDGDEYKKIINYCENINIPVSFFITSMIAKALCRIANQSDTCFFYLNNGRPKANQKNTIGNMVGSCFAFFHNDDKQKYIEYIKTSYIDYLKSVKHGDLSGIEYLTCALKHSLRIRRLNYFSIAISCLNIGYNIKFEEDLKVGFIDYDYQPFPFYCNIQNYDDEMHIILSYQSKLISKEKLQTIKDELLNCFAQALSENRSVE